MSTRLSAIAPAAFWTLPTHLQQHFINKSKPIETSQWISNTSDPTYINQPRAKRGPPSANAQINLDSNHSSQSDYASIVTCGPSRNSAFKYLPSAFVFVSLADDSRPLLKKQIARRKKALSNLSRNRAHHLMNQDLQYQQASLLLDQVLRLADPTLSD